jgi:hypothetical protein
MRIVTGGRPADIGNAMGGFGKPLKISRGQAESGFADDF